jgi:hypothetical protein
MIDAASSALGIDHTGLVRSLVADHEGQTLNAAVDQELRDARAVLVSRLSRTDASPPPTVADLDALDAAIADVAATPCSSGEEDQVASPAPVAARAR